MQEATGDVLSCIYKHLDLCDVANASRVCRRWCVNLWSASAQQALWVPRIAAALRTKTVCHNAMRAVMTTDQLHRVLPTVFSSDDCSTAAQQVSEYLNTQLPRKVDEFIARIARNIVGLPPLMACAFAAPDDTLASTRLVRALFPISAESAELRPARLWNPMPQLREVSAMYLLDNQSNLQVHVGSFEYSDHTPLGFVINNGSVFLDGVLMYEGTFQQGTPHGHGKIYRNGVLHYDGELQRGRPHGHGVVYTVSVNANNVCFDGEWEQGAQHGDGIMYHESSVLEPVAPPVMFTGEFATGEQVRGVWRDCDGSVVHTGEAEELHARIQSLVRAHMCTFGATRHCYVHQIWYHCQTCFPGDENRGVCESCAGRCHRNHKLVKSNDDSSFFCDCGSRGVECVAMTTPCDDDCDCCIPITWTITENEVEW